MTSKSPVGKPAGTTPGVTSSDDHTGDTKPVDDLPLSEKNQKLCENATLEELFKKLLETNTSLNAKLGEIATKLEALIAKAPPGPAPKYNKPTYKRTLRVGETFARLAVQNISDEKLQAARRDLAGKLDFRPIYDDAAFRKDPAGGPQLAAPTSVDDALERVPGATEARDAVIAAFLDKTALDQTTRLLLTTLGPDKRFIVFDYVFLKVVAAGTPTFWDTLAAVEAVRKQLNDHAETLFDSLVKRYAEDRGWSDTAQKSIRKELITRYSSLS